MVIVSNLLELAKVRNCGANFGWNGENSGRELKNSAYRLGHHQLKKLVDKFCRELTSVSMKLTVNMPSPKRQIK
jgi:hypothetical protein